MGQRDQRRDGGGSAEVDVAVVGGGLGGLTAAVHAARAGASVTLFESGRLGGRARTTTVDPGVVLNAGPRALYAGGAAARELAALGVTWSGGVPPTTGARATRGGSVHVLPGTPAQLLRTGLLGTRSKLQVGRLLASLPRRDPASVVGRSVSQWLDGLGLAADASDLLRAVLRLATYVDDPEHLDAGAALAQLQLALGDGVRYLDGGFQRLVDELAQVAATAGVEVHDHAQVGPVRPAARGHGWELSSGAGTTVAAAVVLAVGTPAAAGRLAPVPFDTSGVGPPVTAACLELAVRGTPHVPFLLGIDRPLYLSQHAPAARLAPEGLSVVHVARYGATDDADADEAELWAHASAAGIRRADVVVERFLRRMVVTGGAPSAVGGGLRGRPTVDVPAADGLFLAGDWVGDEGLLADAAVASGAVAGRHAAAVARRTARTSPHAAAAT